MAPFTRPCLMMQALNLLNKSEILDASKKGTLQQVIKDRMEQVCSQLQIANNIINVMFNDNED